MYYHCIPLKYVKYGKINPTPLKEVDEWMQKCYKWLGYYCNYCPQVWLSRSYYSITGFKTERYKENNAVLFCFDILPGSFPISYQPWEDIMMPLMNAKNDDKESLDNEIHKFYTEMEKDFIKEKWPFDFSLTNWINSGRNLDVYLKKHVFIEKEQVIVPSLNLKSAKKIICRNEKQKKALKKMGFLDDRIFIKNIKTVR